MTTKPYTDPDIGKTPQQLFAERNTRVLNALQLKQPDRIPVQLFMSYMLPDMYGVTHQEVQENKDKELELLEKAGAYFQPDIIWGVLNNPYVGTTLALKDVTTKFPGHSGLSPHGSYQFVEDEYMKPEEYDDFIDDPADWAIRKYWPRVFKELEGLSMLPPLGMAAFGTYGISNISFLKIPPIAAAFEALARAADTQAAMDARTQETVGKMISLGFAPPPIAGALVEAPFDLIADLLRGMKNMMLDLRRRPEKILAGVEKVLKFELEYAIAFCKATGLNVTFIPLHRGSDGFMSLPQFEKFYWPTLKTLMLRLIDAGITPVCFYEGTWDQRLKYLAELPKGKTAGWFQSSDIFKVKEVLGDTMCIMGGMRNTLIQAGSPEDVRKFTIELCRKVGKGGGFIMTTTVGEMEGCKPELVKVWVDTTKEYGVYA